MQGFECQEKGRVPYLLGPVVSEQVCELTKQCVDGSSREGVVRTEWGD